MLSRRRLSWIHRNFNDPTVAVLFLDPINQPRFAFRQHGFETIDHVKTARLDYHEQESPTQIGHNGQDMFAKGTAWIDPSDGRILRMTLRLSAVDHGVTVPITVDFRTDERTGFVVPRQMSETYVQSIGTYRQQIECTAIYSNIRRFETSGRIVPRSPINR